MDRRIRQRRASVLRSMRRRRSLLLLGPLVCAIVGVGGYAVSRSPLFAMSTIALRGVPGSLQPSIRSALSPFLGRSALSTPRSELVSAVEAIPLVRTASVKISPFGQVTVSASARAPFAAIAAGTGVEVVDESGVVVGASAVAPQGLYQLCPISSSTNVLSCQGSIAQTPIGSRIAAPYRRSLSVLSALPRSSSVGFHSILSSASQGSVLLNASGNGCLVGTSARLSVKVDVCTQLLSTAPTWEHELVDVTVPALPTESVVP